MANFPRLTEDQKRKIVLMELEGKTMSEIAAYVGRSRPTVTGWKKSDWWKEIKDGYLAEIKAKEEAIERSRRDFIDQVNSDLAKREASRLKKSVPEDQKLEGFDGSF